MGWKNDLKKKKAEESDKVALFRTHVKETKRRTKMSDKYHECLLSS